MGWVSAVFLLACAGAAVGTRLEEAPRLSSPLLRASGILLILISAVWVLPEVAVAHGWILSVACAAGGLALLWVVDRFLYPVCPACSHSHDHAGCATPLHGFAVPLLAATSIHSFFDGWALASSQGANEAVRAAFLLGIALHKVPEGLALGAILRASLESHSRSLLAAIAAEGMTLAGGALAIGLEMHSAHWTGALLAVAAGMFIYLGWHSIEGGRAVRAPAAGVHAHER